MCSNNILKISCNFLLCQLIVCKIFAADTLYFVGHIKILKSTTYKYNLRFVINNQNKITGYSLSDVGGKNETKTKITGTYDSLHTTMNYEETTVLRSPLQKSDLCFVKAALKFKKTKLIETLSGKFIGFDPEKNTQCASGGVKLINTDRYKTIMKQINEEPEPLPSIITPQNIKGKTIQIDNNIAKEFLITGNKIKLTIWDNGAIDGDKISILLNEKYILEDYTITNVTKIIETTLSGNEVDVIKVIALNEGSLPPNTAAVKIETATEKYQIITQAKTNEIRTIYLRKKDKQ